MRKYMYILIFVMIFVFSCDIVSNAEKMYPEDYHVTDEEWEKYREEYKKANPDCTNEELNQQKISYEYSRWSELYGEQIKVEDGNRYLYKYGEVEPDTWFCEPVNGSKDISWYYNHSCWVCSDNTGKLFVSSWKMINDKWYHFDEEGYMNIGWYNDGEDWYYLDSENGDMKFGGWFEAKDHFWYYFDDNGKMLTGWVLDNGNWYYMNESGSAVCACWIEYNDNWYYIGGDYKMQTGWAQVGIGSWYYFDENGAMLTGKHMIDGKKYSFDDSGKCQNK